MSISRSAGRGPARSSRRRRRWSGPQTRLPDRRRSCASRMLPSPARAKKSVSAESSSRMCSAAADLLQLVGNLLDADRLELEDLGARLDGRRHFLELVVAIMKTTWGGGSSIDLRRARRTPAAEAVDFVADADSCSGPDAPRPRPVMMVSEPCRFRGVTPRRSRGHPCRGPGPISMHASHAQGPPSVP